MIRSVRSNHASLSKEVTDEPSVTASTHPSSGGLQRHCNEKTELALRFGRHATRKMLPLREPIRIGRLALISLRCTFDC